MLCHVVPSSQIVDLAQGTVLGSLCDIGCLIASTSTSRLATSASAPGRQEDEPRADDVELPAQRFGHPAGNGLRASPHHDGLSGCALHLCRL